MNFSILNVIFLNDEIKIVSNEDNDILDEKYINILCKYNDKFLIEYIKTEYKLTDISNKISFHNIDIFKELEIDPSDLEQLYAEIISENKELEDDLIDFPGNNKIMRFTNYFISGISIILTFFELIKNGELFYPIELAFPDVDININVINKQYYNYFNYYIKTLTSLSKNEVKNKDFIKQLLEYISDYFIIFKNLFNKDDVIQDMNCIHASTLGYGMYLEKRIQIFLENVDNLNNIKTKEISKYYDNAILDFAEKFENLKNEMNLSKDHILNCTKRSKDEINNYVNTLKLTLYDDIRKKTNESHSKNLQESTIKYESLKKDFNTEIEKSINSLTLESISKIRTEINEIFDKKNGLDLEINKCMTKLETYFNERSEELFSTINLEKEKILSFNNLEKERLNNFSESLKTQIKDDISKIRFDIVKSIKEQSKEILDSMFDHILKNFGTAIETQINKKIDKKFEELSKEKNSI